MRVTVSGLDNIRNAVNRLLNVQDRVLAVARRLCEVGEPIIRQTHGHHAFIQIIDNGNGYSLSAEGTDILFIEFGTGDRAGIYSTLYDQVPVVVRPGSWSEAHGGEYAATGGYGRGFWHFGGLEYHYTEPHPAFYDAYQAMVQALPRIAQEEFNR